MFGSNLPRAIIEAGAAGREKFLCFRENVLVNMWVKVYIIYFGYHYTKWVAFDNMGKC
jgi:hypothetical protein